MGRITACNSTYPISYTDFHQCAFGPSSRYWTNQNTKTLVQQRIQVLLPHLRFLLGRALFPILKGIRLDGHEPYPFEHDPTSVSYFRKAADPAFAACLTGNTFTCVQPPITGLVIKYYQAQNPPKRAPCLIGLSLKHGIFPLFIFRQDRPPRV